MFISLSFAASAASASSISGSYKGVTHTYLGSLTAKTCILSILNDENTKNAVYKIRILNSDNSVQKEDTLRLISSKLKYEIKSSDVLYSYDEISPDLRIIAAISLKYSDTTLGSLIGVNWNSTKYVWGKANNKVFNCINLKKIN